jgi:hypothetical protein
MSVNYHMEQDKYAVTIVEAMPAMEHVPGPYIQLRIGDVSIFPTPEQFLQMRETLNAFHDDALDIEPDEIARRDGTLASK